ncbi:MAG: class I SAM-dependent methyltransferase [Aristaeellaceae bacterium]
MKPMASDWYRKIWTLDIQNQSWVEDTKRQVDFLVEKLGLTGGERVLDLACGFGRHSLELARRGYDVTGVDITPAYVDYAAAQAQAEHLNARFIRSDIRDVDFADQFDVVLNMADGAVGYLESEAENLKIFDVIARALRPGGRHFMDIMNGSYADSHFPCRQWEAGEKCLTLSNFEWDPQSRILLYGQLDYAYGDVLPKPEMQEGNPIRLYTLEEVRGILAGRGLTVFDSYADFGGTPSSENHIQLMVCSRKQ